MPSTDQGMDRGATDPTAEGVSPDGMFPDAATPELSARELAERLRGPNPPTVIDVREPWEHRVAHLVGSRLVPLGTLPAALSTFDPGTEYVLLCHHGVRSLTGLHLLRARGLTRITHLAGGIDAWSTDVDPAVPRY